jgi:hypothetical protein
MEKVMKIITKTIVVTSILLYSHAIDAQTHSHQFAGVSVEIDPAPFFQHGYSIAAGYEFNKYRLSVNLFKSDLPTFILQKNWNAKIIIGSALRMQYYFNETREGLFVGAQAGFLKLNYSYTDESYSSKVTQIAVTPTVGYLWFPFPENGFYLMPAAGIGFTLATSGKVASEYEKYNQFRPAYITALHIGYEF